MEKNEILKAFSTEPTKYYNVDLFDDLGFDRRACSVCGRFFWTLDTERTKCPDDADDMYSFIGDPPTSKRFDYTQAWQQVKDFFVENHHTPVSRYPVVCRWRDDLYFTIASVVDFQRVMGSKVLFEFPANPLIVPQTCLRFNDLDNVGVTGRHFSSFCMIGQLSVPDSAGGYWKDKCIDLDYRLLTDKFGINPKEIVFVEDVWAGGGSFGPSLEYFVRGLELGNAVFTEFQGKLGQHTTLDHRVIDMGAGLERFVWITMGTPTAYDCCFGPIMSKITDAIGINRDIDALYRYYTAVAKTPDGTIKDVRYNAAVSAGITDASFKNMIVPLEGAYLIADHLRTLIFAISDGALPSNVGGGYNLRMMVRRMSGVMTKLQSKLDLDDLVDTHIEYLAKTYPELSQRRDDVKKILNIETARYRESRIHMKRKTDRLRKKGDGSNHHSVDTLLTLYESDGITPEYLMEMGVIREIPSEFYPRLADLHQSNKKDNTRTLQINDTIPDTKLLFYEDDPTTFDATILDVLFDGHCIILDRTSFYARGGGQEPDLGTIGGFCVINVERHANVIVHWLDPAVSVPMIPKQIVQCIVHQERRMAITKNHTSTHIINASCRSVLGSWVWQHSAFKDVDHARLDITHHSSLTNDQVQCIEDAANLMVREDIPVTIQSMERGQAEQTYGFSIYQGGVVPVKKVRIVSIGKKDVEACGGTHVSGTGQIKLIKITKTKRIQDGVVRIEFVSGDAAIKYTTLQNTLEQKRLKVQSLRKDIEIQRSDAKHKARDIIPKILNQIYTRDKNPADGISVYYPTDDNKTTGCVCLVTGTVYDEYFHTTLGKKVVSEILNAVYIGIFESGKTIRVVIYSGDDSGVDIRDLTKEISCILGGSSGGNERFSQGGGKNIKNKSMAIDKARHYIMNVLHTRGKQ